MTIRSKMIMIMLPLLIAPLILTLIVGVLSTRNGITHIATRLLTFKSKVLLSYMDNQWLLLSNHNLQDNPDYINVSKLSIGEYASTLIEDDGENIFAIDGQGQLAMQTGSLELEESTLQSLLRNYTELNRNWQEFTVSGREFISDINYSESYDWYIINSVLKNDFYGTIVQIVYRSFIIFFISLLISVGMLIYFSRYLTKPLHNIDDVIRSIIKTSDLTKRVELLYDDEIGDLGHFFNIMLKELNLADQQMKNYALRAVISKRKEAKIRNIFQKYVPKSVIEQFFNEPESMLQGESRVLGILFSDIRNFTAFSEHLQPIEVVESLNKYFEHMVDVIIRNNGIVDKYIGDAIMAFFGAPVHQPNDALEACTAALEMAEVLESFNEWQKENNRQQFKIGVGINYGWVTIGNIGTEKKMDYTVIGDMVNLASRLEGLTKMYNETVLVSETVKKEINGILPSRLVDRVVVKGKSENSDIFTIRKKLTGVEQEAWALHAQAIDYYMARNFSKASMLFTHVQRLIPDDFISLLYLQRCSHYIKFPPDDKWDGTTVLSSK